MAKTDSGLNRYEIHFTDELMINISKVAVEKFDAKIHHRSKKPELKETIVALLELALKVLEDDPDVLKKDNPYINTDYKRIILEEVNKLIEDKINPLQEQIVLLADKYLDTNTGNSDTDNKQITSDKIEKISISRLTDNYTSIDSNNNDTVLDTNNITDSADNEVVTNTKADENTNEQTEVTLFDLPNDSECFIFSLSGIDLSEKRFGLSKNAVSGRKNRLTDIEFYDWTKEKDPDNIKWKYIDRKTGYQPFDMSLEQEEDLKEWFKENIG